MIIEIPNDKIEQMVKEQVDGSIRKRINEMQGRYTSKGYLENLIRDIIWDKIIELCPNIEIYIKDEVERCITSAFESQSINKKQLVKQIVENLMERF